MRRIVILMALIVLPRAFSARAQIDVPPVSEAVCAHCEARTTQGEAHKTWCPSYRPSQQAQSSSGSSFYSGSYYRPSSPSTSQIVAGTMLPILGQALAASIANNELPHLSERPVLINNSAWGSNGSNNVVYDERSQRKGIWNNDSRGWLLKPYWYDDLIISDMNAVIALKISKKNGARWGIIDPYSGRTLVPFEFGSTYYFGTKRTPIILYYGDNGKGPCKLYLPNENDEGYHMPDKEFEDAKAYWPPSGDIYVSIKENGKWGVLGRNGAYLAEPAWEGVAPAGEIGGELLLGTYLETGGWGLQLGDREVFPHINEWMDVGSHDILYRPRGGHTGVCSLDGRLILQATFDKIERYTSELAPEMNFYKVTTGGKWGLFTDDGVLAVPPLYTDEQELEVAAATCQRESYSQYVKRLALQLSVTKDEFETTAQFEARKSNPSLQEEYLATKLSDAGIRFVTWSLDNARHDRMNGYKIILSDYDADNGCFYLSNTATPHHNPYILYVPLDKARQFKEEFPAMSKTALEGARYVVNMDTLCIGRMEFTLSDGTTYSIFNQTNTGK